MKKETPAGLSKIRKVMILKEDDESEKEGKAAAFKGSANGETLKNPQRIQKDKKACRKPDGKKITQRRNNPDIPVRNKMRRNTKKKRSKLK